MELQNGKIWVLRAVNSKDKPVWMWQDIWGSKMDSRWFCFCFYLISHTPLKSFATREDLKKIWRIFYESVRNSKPKAKIRMTNGDFPNSRQSTINFLLLPSSLLYSREWHLPHRGDHAYSSMCLTRLGFGLVAMTSAAALINNDSWILFNYFSRISTAENHLRNVHRIVYTIRVHFN